MTILSYSYLSPVEFFDLEIEEKFFKTNATAGRFYNKVIIGTLFVPPQDDPGLIKVRLCAKNGAKSRIVEISQLLLWT